MDASMKTRSQEKPGGTRLGDRIAGDTRFAWRIVLAVLLIYVASFAVFHPVVVTNMDEAAYVRLAQFLSEGSTRGRQMDPFTGRWMDVLPSTYAVGTAALMTPFVWAGGWRGAFAVPLLGLVLGVILTAHWIAGEKRSPLFALLAVGFLPTLVMSRVAMSDVPSLALVSLGLWLFWRGIERGWLFWLASGFVAGSSLLIRNTNVLPFIPFFVGSALRREKQCWALIVGGWPASARGSSPATSSTETPSSSEPSMPSPRARSASGSPSICWASSCSSPAASASLSPTAAAAGPSFVPPSSCSWRSTCSRASARSIRAR
jgi:hypothetical protein